MSFEQLIHLLLKTQPSQLWLVSFGFVLFILGFGGFVFERERERKRDGDRDRECCYVAQAGLIHMILLLARITSMCYYT